jgi:hypothetical protein
VKALICGAGIAGEERLAEEHLDFFLSCVLHAPKRADVDEQA